MACFLATQGRRDKRRRISLSDATATRKGDAVSLSDAFPSDAVRWSDAFRRDAGSPATQSDTRMSEPCSVPTQGGATHVLAQDPGVVPFGTDGETHAWFVSPAFSFPPVSQSLAWGRPWKGCLRAALDTA